MNKPSWVSHTCLDSFTAIWIQPMFGKILLIFSVSVATVIELNMSRFTYMFSSWPQNHLTMLSRYAVRTITIDHEWILSVTTDSSVLATASFRCCEFAGRLRVITSLPAVAAVAIAGEVCPEFSPCLTNSISWTFVPTWLSSKKRLRKVCVHACAPNLPASAQKILWQPLN